MLEETVRLPIEDNPGDLTTPGKPRHRVGAGIQRAGPGVSSESPGDGAEPDNSAISSSSKATPTSRRQRKGGGATSDTPEAVALDTATSVPIDDSPGSLATQSKGHHRGTAQSGAAGPDGLTGGLDETQKPSGNGTDVSPRPPDGSRAGSGGRTHRAGGKGQQRDVDGQLVDDATSEAVADAEGPLPPTQSRSARGRGSTSEGDGISVGDGSTAANNRRRREAGKGRQPDADGTLVDEPSGETLADADGGLVDGQHTAHRRSSRGPEGGSDSDGEGVSTGNRRRRAGGKGRQPDADGTLVDEPSGQTVTDADSGLAAQHSGHVHSLASPLSDAGSAAGFARSKADAAEQLKLEQQRLKDAAQRRDESDLIVKKLVVRATRSGDVPLTKAEVALLEKHFQSADLNGNNSIELKEFVNFYNDNFGSALNKAELQEIFQRVDIDGSGVLEFEEFLELYKQAAVAAAVKNDPKLEPKLKHLLVKRRRQGPSTAKLPIDFLPDEIEGMSVSELHVERDREFATLDAQRNAVAPFENNSPLGKVKMEALKRDMTRRAHEIARRRTSGHAFQEMDMAELDEEVGMTVADSDQGLSKRRSSAHRHRLPGIPPWGLLAKDEEQDDAQLAKLTAARDGNIEAMEGSLEDMQALEDKVAQRIMELSIRKRDENEALFQEMPFVDPLPRGVPLSELHLSLDGQVGALRKQREELLARGEDDEARKIELQIQDRIALLALQRESAVREMTRRRSVAGRRGSQIPPQQIEAIRRRRNSEHLLADPVYKFHFDELSAALDAGDLIRAHEEDEALGRRADDIGRTMTKEQILAAREAEAARRKQEVLDQNAADARRKAEIEAAILQKKQQGGAKTREELVRLKDDAHAKDEAQAMIKKMLVRAQRSNELTITPEEIGTLQHHFQRFDADGSGSISKKEFSEFYLSMFGEQQTRREIEDLYEVAVSSEQAMTFEDFVEVYREVARLEAIKRDPKMQTKLKSTLVKKSHKADPRTPVRKQPVSPQTPPTATSFKRPVGALSPSAKPLEPHKPASKTPAKTPAKKR